MLAREASRCRSHMLGLLRRVGVDTTRGYSTHVSISIPRGRERETAEAFAVTVGPALILLMESRQSPGLLLRTRRGRLELGSEYVDDEGQLTAAMTFLTGAVHAYLCNPGNWALFPRLRLKHWEEADIRPGIYLPPDAYGESIHESGGGARLETEDGKALTAGQILQLGTDVVAKELKGLVNPQVLETLLRFARRERLLQIEGHGDPAHIAAHAVHPPAPEANTLRTLVRAPRLHLQARFVDWEGAAFGWHDSGRAVILGVPWANLPALFTAARNDDISNLVSRLGSPRPHLNSLDQLGSTQVFQQLDPTSLRAEALGDKGGAGTKGGHAKQPGPLKTFEPAPPFIAVPRPPSPWSRVTILGLVLLLGLIGLTAIVVLGQPHRGKPIERPVATVTAPSPLQGVPVPPRAANTPTAVKQCLASPSLINPPNGAIRAGNTLLSWTSTATLGKGQTFAVLVASSEGDLSGSSAKGDIVASTGETSLTLDFSKWRNAGTLGTFYWTVRIQGPDGRFLDCGTTAPSGFSVEPTPEPTKRPKQQSGSGSTSPGTGLSAP